MRGWGHRWAILSVAPMRQHRHMKGAIIIGAGMSPIASLPTQRGDIVPVSIATFFICILCGSRYITSLMSGTYNIFLSAHTKCGFHAAGNGSAGTNGQMKNESARHISGPRDTTKSMYRPCARPPHSRHTEGIDKPFDTMTNLCVHR